MGERFIFLVNTAIPAGIVWAIVTSYGLGNPNEVLKKTFQIESFNEDLSEAAGGKPSTLKLFKFQISKPP